MRALLAKTDSRQLSERSDGAKKKRGRKNPAPPVMLPRTLSDRCEPSGGGSPRCIKDRDVDAGGGRPEANCLLACSEGQAVGPDETAGPVEDAEPHLASGRVLKGQARPAF